MAQVRINFEHTLQEFGSTDDEKLIDLSSGTIAAIYNNTGKEVYINEKGYIDSFSTSLRREVEKICREAFLRKIRERVSFSDARITAADIEDKIKTAYEKYKEEERKEEEERKARKEEKEREKKEQEEVFAALVAVAKEKREILEDEYKTIDRKIYLIDGTKISTYNINDRKAAIERLQSIDEKKILRNVIEQQREKIKELERKFEEEKENLLREIAEEGGFSLSSVREISYTVTEADEDE